MNSTQHRMNSTHHRPTTAHPAGPLDVSALGTILSIWAHPDDETYLAGGIMAVARDHGQRVVCVSATAGEHGTPDPLTWPPDRLGTVRRWEAAAAMAVLGVGEHHIYGLPDGGLEDLDAQGRAWVHRVIEVIAPDTILTFGPEGMTFHPDHIAVHRWVTDAWAQRGRRSRLLHATTTVEHLDRFRDLYEEWDMYMTDQRPAGIPEDQLAVHMRLDGSQLDRKLAALRSMATQTGGPMTAIDPATFAAQVREESFVDAATTRERWDGHRRSTALAPG